MLTITEDDVCSFTSSPSEYDEEVFEDENIIIEEVEEEVIDDEDIIIEEVEEEVIDDEDIIIEEVEVEEEVWLDEVEEEEGDVEEEFISIRSAKKVLHASEGFTASDCVIQFDLKLSNTTTAFYFVSASVVVQNESSSGSDDEIVGYLEGEIIKRPHPMFYEVAHNCKNGDDDELYELSTLFCDSNGIVTIDDNELLYPSCVNEGGFFHIHLVEIRPDYREIDLGLRLIHETFVFLGDDWNLAVMKPRSLNSDIERWKEEDDEELLNERQNVLNYVCKPCITNTTTTIGNGVSGSPPNVQCFQAPSNNDDDVDSVEEKHLSVLMEYFARIGFTQAGNNPDQAHAFFITSELYFSPSGLYNGDPIKYWIDKIDIANQIDIYVPPKKHVPTTALNLQLQNLLLKVQSSRTLLDPMMNAVVLVKKTKKLSSIQKFKNAVRLVSIQRNCIEGMKNLIHQGASIYDSRAMHIAASHADKIGAGILLALIIIDDAASAAHEKSCIHDIDEYGNTPLHSAALSMSIKGIEVMLQAGADSNATNLSGYTPYQCFQYVLRKRQREQKKSMGAGEKQNDDDDDHLEEKISLLLG